MHTQNVLSRPLLMVFYPESIMKRRGGASRAAGRGGRGRGRGGSRGRGRGKPKDKMSQLAAYFV